MHIRTSETNGGPIICDDKKIKNDIACSLKVGDILDDSTHAKVLRNYRNRYRLAAIKHVLGNLHRYKKRDLPRLLKWGYARMKYILSIRDVEDSDPYVIYRGPMKG